MFSEWKRYGIRGDLDLGETGMPRRSVVVCRGHSKGFSARSSGLFFAAQTDLAEGSLLARGFAELAAHAQDSDRVIGVVLDADMEEVVRVAVLDAAERVRVRELDARFDVGLGGTGRRGECGLGDTRREEERRERG